MLVLGDVQDFTAALSTEALVDVVLTKGGRFYARLARVGLPEITVWRVEETLPRIAFIDNHEDRFLVSCPNPGSSRAVWAGLELDDNHMVTVGPGERLHARTLGACQWNAIWFPAAELARYGRAVLGMDAPIPGGVCRWTISSARLRELRFLTTSAANSIVRHPQPLTGDTAVHGLEQEIIDQLMKCLASGVADTGSGRSRQSHRTAVNVERLVVDTLRQDLRIEAVCAALGVSERRLRHDCALHLGLGVARYKQLKRLEAARRLLSNGRDPDTTVAAAALQFGIRHMGRFAGAYQELFGELPSVTAARGPRRSLPRLSLRRVVTG